MAEGKWIAGLSPEMDLEEAARPALRQRLEHVESLLPLPSGGEEEENVHQFRVATRRADACLRIFRDCLPKKVYRASRARLRTLRRAAGAVRDGDVFLASLRGRAATARPGDLAGLDFIIGHTLGQRDLARRQLEAVEESQPESIASALAKTLDAVSRPRRGAESLGELAGRTLRDRRDRFDQACGADLQAYDHLHQVRIAGKRLRYAIEVLADCFGPALRDRLYPLTEEMQETLGRANDSHGAVSRLQALRVQLQAWPSTWGRVRGGVEGLLRFHQRRLPQERRRFLAWLSRWQALDFDVVLAQGAGDPARLHSGR